MLQRRNLAIMLGLCLLLTACSGLVTVAKEENLIVNGDFEKGETGWSIGGRVEGKNYIVDGCFTITSDTCSTDKDNLTFIWQNLKDKLEKDTTYILSFDRNVTLTGQSVQRLYITLNDKNTPNNTYQIGDGFLKPRSTGDWVRTTLAFTTPSGFDPSSASIQIVCNTTSFGTDKIFKIDNVKLIKSTEWIGFRGTYNMTANNAIRQWTTGKAENSIIDLGDNTIGYEQGKDRLCTMYYSARKSADLETATPVPASVTIAIYETGDAPRLVYVYQKDVSAVENQVNTPSNSLQTVLEDKKEYTAKVFAWNSVSGLSPIVPADTLTFTYTAPTSTT